VVLCRPKGKRPRQYRGRETLSGYSRPVPDSVLQIFNAIAGVLLVVWAVNFALEVRRGEASLRDQRNQVRPLVAVGAIFFALMALGILASILD
jgi:hypothetical protein